MTAPCNALYPRTLILCVFIAVVGGFASNAAASVSNRSREDLSAANGVRFLLKQIGNNGMCAGEYPKDNPRYGGKTGLCVYACLTAGVGRGDPVLSKAIAWLTKTKLTGTYAVAMRACALSACKTTDVLAQLRKDARWLIKASNGRGAYSYTPADRKSPDTCDNSNSQMAAVALWEISKRGIKIPDASWREIQQHWLDEQQIDGGWGYRVRKGELRTRTYGSMTAAGLATLYICFDTLQQDQFVRCRTYKESVPIAKAHKWLAKRFSSGSNPGKGVQWYYYWMYCLERAGLASGRKHIGGAPWFSLGARQLLMKQNGDGSWGYGKASQQIAETSFAVLFLARGRHPIIANKLQYKGKWNCRPRDLANLARHISYRFETNVSWQVLGPKASLDDLHDSPILYISGAGPIQLTDHQIYLLRQYVQQGGTILSEAAGNNGSFTLDMQGIYAKLFPKYPMKRLDDAHQIYSLYYKAKHLRGLSGVSNGARLLAVHAPRELSLAMQLGTRQTDSNVHNLLANIYLMTTDRTRARKRGTSPWPKAQAFTPVRTITVTRLKHSGNYDPEPQAWKRCAILAGNLYGVKLEVAPPMSIAKLDADKHPVAVMTGTGSFHLTKDEEVALRKYFIEGGILIADAAGGDKTFTETFTELIGPLVPKGRDRELARHIVLEGPAKLDGVSYHPALAALLGAEQHVPKLRCITHSGKLAIAYSRYDITMAMSGYQGYHVQGYTGDSAVAITVNLLAYATDQSAKARATTTPATTQPASQPTSSTQPTSQPASQPQGLRI